MITLTNAEAALFHALLINAADLCEDVGKQASRLRDIAIALMPAPELPEPNRSSHQS